MADHTRKKPWHRRPGESVRQHNWFMHYANIPSRERNLNKAYRAWVDNPKAVTASNEWRGAYNRHRWKARADALDDERSAARIRGQLKGIETSWAGHAEQLEDLYTASIVLAFAAYEKAKSIYEKELTKDNYSMAHAVQMQKMVIEQLKLVRDLTAAGGLSGTGKVGDPSDPLSGSGGGGSDGEGVSDQYISQFVERMERRYEETVSEGSPEASAQTLPSRA